MDGEAWQATVHGVTKSQTQPKHFTSVIKWLFSILRKDDKIRELDWASLMDTTGCVT